MKLDVLKIQRSQEPSVNDDSESEKSDEEEDEEIYVDVPPVGRHFLTKSKRFRQTDHYRRCCDRG